MNSKGSLSSMSSKGSLVHFRLASSRPVSSFPPFFVHCPPSTERKVSLRETAKKKQARRRGTDAPAPASRQKAVRRRIESKKKTPMREARYIDSNHLHRALKKVENKTWEAWTDMDKEDIEEYCMQVSW